MVSPAFNVAAAIAFFAARERWRAYEALPWLIAVAAFFLLPDYMVLGTQVVILRDQA